MLCCDVAVKGDAVPFSFAFLYRLHTELSLRQLWGIFPAQKYSP
jgi:hypothetical protein